MSLINLLFLNSLFSQICPPDFSVCQNAPSFVLVDATPIGGIYSGNGVISNEFNPLLAGVGNHLITYTIDLGAGDVTCSFTINVSPLPSIPAAIVVEADCGVDNGRVDVTSPLGATLEYSIDNGQNWQSSISFTNLIPNSDYTISVRDLNENSSCISANTFTVSSFSNGFTSFASATRIKLFNDDNQNLIYNTTGSDVDCINTDCNTLLQGRNFGAFNPNSGQFKISAGEIKTSKTSGNVCSASMSFRVYKVGDTPGIFQTVPLNGLSDCEDSNGDGVLDQFEDGFGPCGLNDQKWKDYSLDIDLTQGICEGNYLLEVFYSFTGSECSLLDCSEVKQTDNNGEYFVATFSINAIPTPVVGTITQPTCSNFTGSVNLSNLPNTSWSLNPSGLSGTSTSATISNLSPGTYNFIVTNMGCPSQPSSNVVINPIPEIPAAPIASVTLQTSCSQQTGQITVSSPLGNGFEYSLNGNSFQANPIFNNLAPGTYPITVRNTNNSIICISSPTNLVINVPPPLPTAPSGISPQSFCIENNAQITDLVVVGSEINWYSSASGGSPLNSNSILVNGQTYFASQTIGGCEGNARLPIIANITNVVISPTFISDATCGKFDGFISVNTSGGQEPYTFLWSNGSSNDTLSNIGEGEYTLLVTDQNSCQALYSQSIACVLLDIPQLVSPGSNGKNETWIVGLGQAYPNMTLSIFNRWGNEVFSASPYLDDWNGQCNSGLALGGDILPNGTYFYIIDLKDGKKPISGYIELIK